jgi:hypothetical protein
VINGGSGFNFLEEKGSTIQNGGNVSIFLQEKQNHHRVMVDLDLLFSGKVDPPLRNGGSIFNFFWESRSTI